MSAHTSARGRRALGLRREPVLRSRAARGDQAAFSALYERHHQALYRYCRSILQHDQDAQDALHNAMLRAFAALQEEQRDFELRPWLFRIAHNEAISIVRRRRETGEPVLEAEDPRSLEDAVGGREDFRVLREDLRHLTDKQRSALVLRELSGLSPAEIGHVLGSSPGAAKQTVTEARLALHECREGRAMPCDDVCRALSDGDGRVLRGRRVRAHLRSCPGCRGFREDLQRRPQALAALAPPLPAAAGVALLHQLLPAAGKAASAAWRGGGGSVLGAAGTKVAIGAAVVAAAGATEIAVHPTRPAARHAAGIAPARPSGARSGAAGTVPAGTPAAAPVSGTRRASPPAAAPGRARGRRGPAEPAGGGSSEATTAQPATGSVAHEPTPSSVDAGGSAGAAPAGGHARSPSASGPTHRRTPAAGSHPSGSHGRSPSPPTPGHGNGSAPVRGGHAGQSVPEATAAPPPAVPPQAGPAAPAPPVPGQAPKGGPPASGPSAATPGLRGPGPRAQDQGPPARADTSPSASERPRSRP